MIIKLTKLGSSILINFANVTSCETMNTPQGQLTKVWLSNGTYINVEESLEDILQFQQDFINGNYQDTKVIVKPFVERMEESYNTKRQRVRRPHNNQELFNNNQW